MPRILLTSPVLQNNAQGPFRDVLEGAGLEVVGLPPGAQTFDEDSLIRLLDGVDGTLASMEPYTREVLAATRLRAIARHGVGYDAIDVPAATEHGVAVVIAAGANHDCVAEQTIALLMGVFRGVVNRDRSVRARRWDRGPLLPRLAGRTFGIVGLGRIGRAVVPRAIGLGLNIIAYDPVANAASAAALGVRLVPLDTLFAEADIVSLHCPNTPETANMINARSLARMKPGSVLLNASRGGLVDEPALVDALKSGHLFGAGLDVFQQEPPAADNPLLDLENVVLSPHMAGLDEVSIVAMATRAAEGLAALFQGGWPEGCVVNEEIRPGWAAGKSTGQHRSALPFARRVQKAQGWRRGVSFFELTLRRLPWVCSAIGAAPQLRVERTPAAARLLRVRIIERESAAADVFEKIDRRAVEVEIALLVDHHGHAEAIALRVFLGVELIVEAEGILETAAAAAGDAHAEHHFARHLLVGNDLLNFLRSPFG